MELGSPWSYDVSGDKRMAAGGGEVQLSELPVELIALVLDKMDDEDR